MEIYNEVSTLDNEEATGEVIRDCDGQPLRFLNEREYEKASTYQINAERTLENAVILDGILRDENASANDRIKASQEARLSRAAALGMGSKACQHRDRATGRIEAC
jgi:hypothetical protein